MAAALGSSILYSLGAILTIAPGRELGYFTTNDMVDRSYLRCRSTFFCSNEREKIARTSHICVNLASQGPIESVRF